MEHNMDDLQGANPGGRGKEARKKHETRVLFQWNVEGSWQLLAACVFLYEIYGSPF